VRRAPLALACLLAAAAPAAAAVTSLPPPPPRGPQVVVPGLSYQRLERDGQVAHIMRLVPRAPLGLRPALTGDQVTRRGRLTDAIRARLDTGVVAGVNADYFNLDGGWPSGLLAEGDRLLASPEASRSALVVGPGLALAVERLLLAGRWQVQDPASATPFAVRTMATVNRPIGSSTGVVLYTRDFGGRTPSGPVSEAAVTLDVDAPLRANQAVTGTVVATGTGGGTEIAPGRVVLAASGGARPSLVGDLQLGRRVRIEASVAGVPADGSGAVGGGPLLVQDGQVVPDAGEGFTPLQTGQRTARTAVGQAGSGTILLVTTEGPQQGRTGYSVAEQAELMASLGAVRAIGFDSGGSALMAVGDRLVIPWSDERPISDALLVTYGGAQLTPVAPARVSPGGDGVDDAARAVVRSAVPGQVTVALERRGGGRAATLFEGALGPGAREVVVDPRALGVPDGPYRLAATLTPADGSAPTTQSRPLVVDGTLSALRLRKLARGTGAARRTDVQVRFTLRRPARVSVLVQDAAGRTLRRIAAGRSLARGAQVVPWDGTLGRRPARGSFRIVVEARTFLGLTGLQTDLTLP
jgi:hypothetical protein